MIRNLIRLINFNLIFLKKTILRYVKMDDKDYENKIKSIALEIENKLTEEYNLNHIEILDVAYYIVKKINNELENNEVNTDNKEYTDNSKKIALEIENHLRITYGLNGLQVLDVAYYIENMII